MSAAGSETPGYKGDIISQFLQTGGNSLPWIQSNPLWGPLSEHKSHERCKNANPKSPY